MSEQRYEYCAKCGDPTGKAGAGEDSIYWLDGHVGPLCDSCNDQLREQILDDSGEIAALRASAVELERERDEARARLALVEPVIEIARSAIDELRVWREAYLMRADLDNNGSVLHVIASREREQGWLDALRAAEQHEEEVKP